MKDTMHSFGRSITPKTRLFCFPYAGGTTGIFRPWHSLLAPTIEVIGIRYRGRGARLCETPFRSISDIVEEIQTEIADLLDEPYAIFGHSMGAMVAFDLARRLSTRPGRTPQHLFLSGLSAPHKRDPGKPIHDLPNDAFIEALGTLGGTPPDVLRNVELLDLLTPAIRADLEAAYRWRPERKFDLGLPITVFGGDADRDIPFDHLQAWSAYTTSATEVVLHPGGHFFLHARYQEMARMIRCRLMDTDDGLKSLVAASVERERWSSTAVGALVPTGSEEEERYLIRWRSAVEAGSKVATAMSQGQAQRLRTQLRTLNELAGIIVDNTLQSLGLFEGAEVLTAEEISSRSMVIEGQKRALCRLIAIAIETGLLVSQVDGHYVRCRPWRDKLSALDLALMREDFAENTDLFDFVCSFGCALPDILTGRVHPAEMLFRDGLINVATRLYCDSPPFRYCNAVASAVMNSFTQATTSDADLHVVEIGAGTGATTKAILCGMNSGIGRFLFTDVSNFFLVDAKRAFCDLTFVDYDLLDIEKPPQEKLHNSFDIAVAAHVLHATRRIHETLSHVRSLLKAGGTLILLEETSMQAFFSVTMGTQTGFDRFDDMPLRINHPLLSAEHWEDQALRAGFRRFAAFPEVMGIRPMLIQA